MLGSLGILTFSDGKWRGNRIAVAGALLATLLCLGNPAAAGPKSTKLPTEGGPPTLVLSGGRSLAYEREFSSDRDVRIKRGFWTKVLDTIAGPPDLHVLVRPYSVVTDSKSRVIVTDPGVSGVHIFDFG